MIHLITRNLFLIYFCLTVIEWLGIDLTGTVSVNAPLFGHIYISWVNSQHLNVAFRLGFKEFEASDVLKSSYTGRSLLGLPYIHYFPGQLLSYSRSAGGT